MSAAPREGGRVPRLTAFLVVLVLVLGVAVLAGRNLLPDLRSPFGTETKDRTGPVLLKSIQDMSRYQAAEGTFQVVVDLEKDAKFLPDAVRGSRTLYVGNGSVASYVDFGGLDDGAVRVSDDEKSVSVRLPHAKLAKPSLDVERSYPVTKERGLLDRIGDFFTDNPDDEREVHKLAVRHISEAARESDLEKRAEKNTTDMLEGMLRSLKFEDVSVTYAEEAKGN
ncbi:DUF4230 domain-containing protein [Streptomyces daliensis]|uniref:DUF4230 domain-containing protein n=1 Tax=Streptomyces daliensis TaxID=299421 RepID=A0A8T4IPL2_9ACTN|nr:DUF4230 domain-containing protein [Streptomyces daliensis]